MKHISILVFGTGKGCNFFISLLKDSKCIKAFVDSDSKKIGTKYNNIDVISPNEIRNYSYNYIIIASQFYLEIKNLLLKLGISLEKVIEFYRILPIKLEEKFNLQNNILKFVNENYKMMVTGISYALRGINEEKFNINTINLAMSSQDLYYDYNIVKYLFELKPNNRIKKMILGISYYSFHYDLSLSSVNDRCLIYYKNLDKLHNFNDIIFLQSYKNYNLIEENIFKKNYLFTVLCFDKRYNNLLEKLLSGNLQEDKYTIGKQRAEKHSNKNYPKTYNENVSILKDYIRFLNNNKVEVNLMVFPVTKYYYEHFSEKLISEFYEAILEIRQECNFHIYDFFNSKLFHDDDFDDVTHLNKKGADKMTRLLNCLL